MIQSREKIPERDISEIATYFEESENRIADDNEYEFLIINSRAKPALPRAHQAAYYSLSICTNGSSSMIINGNKVTFSEGELLFLSPQHVIGNINSSPDFRSKQILFRKTFLHSGQALDELLWINPEKIPVFRLKRKGFAKADRLFEKLREEASLSQDYHKQILRNGITELLYRLNRLENSCLSKGKQSSSQSNRLYKQFKDLVEEQYQQEKKVNGYAKRLHVSPKHLSEVVKEESGLTALEHIHQRILREAKNLLTHTEKTAKEIAYDLGYSTPSQFGRFFKRKTGQSPIQFRKNRKTAH